MKMKQPTNIQLLANVLFCSAMILNLTSNDWLNEWLGEDGSEQIESPLDVAIGVFVLAIMAMFATFFIRFFWNFVVIAVVDMNKFTWRTSLIFAVLFMFLGALVEIV